MDTLNRSVRPESASSTRADRTGRHRTTKCEGLRSIAPRCFALILTIVLWAAVGVSPLWAEQKSFRIGMLVLSEATMKTPQMAVFVPTLAKLGYEEGRNLQIEYRYAKGETLDFTEAANELAQMKVDVIYAVAAPMGRAAFAATKTIPLVIQDYTNDPIALGYATSYNRPGKNVTGVFLDAPELAGKLVETMQAMVPRLKQLAVMWDPRPGRTHVDAVTIAARKFGLRVKVFELSGPSDFEPVFRKVKASSQAMIIMPSPMTYVYADRVAALAKKYKVPAASMAKQFAQLGGAVSYGPDNMESTLRNADQIAKILSGRAPGDIPIERPYKYHFLINMQAVREMNLKVPDYLLLGAELVGK